MWRLSRSEPPQYSLWLQRVLMREAPSWMTFDTDWSLLDHSDAGPPVFTFFLFQLDRGEGLTGRSSEAVEQECRQDLTPPTGHCAWSD